MSGFIELVKAILTLFAKSAKLFPVGTKKKELPTTVTYNKLSVHYKDSKRHLAEIESLKQTNPGLLNVIEFVREFCEREFNKEIVVTMILRTEAEQDELYKNSAKYKLKKFKSPHQFGHAFDLRSKTFTIPEIDKLVSGINLRFDRFNHYNVTAMYHDVGSGLHFHIQFCKKGGA